MLSFIYKKQVNLILKEVCVKRLYHISQLQQVNDLFAKEVPVEARPSKDFILSISNQDDKNNFITLIGQLCLFYKNIDEVPKVLTDNDWERLLRIKTAKDRNSYLFHLYLSEINKKPPNIDEDILKEDEKKYANGEMVYGPNYYQYINCYGSDYRERINQQYGYNYYSALRNNETVPRILFDCRHLFKTKFHFQRTFTLGVQKFWNYIYFNGYPFDIKITDFITDPALSDLVKNNFLFLNEEQEEDTNIGSDGVITSSLESYPFRPTISTKKNYNFYNKKDNRIAFITPYSRQNLPDDLTMFDTFIIAATDEARDRASLTIAIDEKLPAFKLPIEKYTDSKRSADKLDPFVMGKLLTSVYYKEMNWKDSLLTHLLEINLPSLSESEKEELTIKNVKRRKIIKDVERFTFDFKRKITLKKKEAYEEKNNNRDPITGKNKIVHRYSRDERNMRRSKHTSESHAS